MDSPWWHDGHVYHDIQVVDAEYKIDTDNTAQRFESKSPDVQSAHCAGAQSGGRSHCIGTSLLQCLEHCWQACPLRHGVWFWSGGHGCSLARCSHTSPSTRCFPTKRCVLLRCTSLAHNFWATNQAWHVLNSTLVPHFQCSCGQSIEQSGNEASNRDEAMFTSV